MNVWEFILENRVILIPALVIIGYFVKAVKVIPYKWIPIIYLLFVLWQTSQCDICI